MKTLVAEIFEMHMQSPLGNFCWSGVAAASFFAEIFTIFCSQKFRGRGESPLTNGPVAGTSWKDFFLGGRPLWMEQHLNFFRPKVCPSHLGSFF